MSVSATPSDVRFVAVSLDCADPAELAEFYLQMLGGRLLWSRQGQRWGAGTRTFAHPAASGKLPSAGVAWRFDRSP
jgi:hypothetical protein